MMRARVRYYGFFSEITGKEHEDIAVKSAAGKSVREIVDERLLPFLDDAIILVNGIAVRPDYRVKAGDEVKILPHVGGG